MGGFVAVGQLFEQSDVVVVGHLAFGYGYKKNRLYTSLLDLSQQVLFLLQFNTIVLGG